MDQVFHQRKLGVGTRLPAQSLGPEEFGQGIRIEDIALENVVDEPLQRLDRQVVPLGDAGQFFGQALSLELCVALADVVSSRPRPSFKVAM